MPNVPENYVHRIGRTARAGASGTAVSFCSPGEMGEFQAVEKLLKKTIPVLGGAPWAADLVAAAPKPGQRQQRPQGRGAQASRPKAAGGGGRPGAKPVGAAKPQGQGAGGKGAPRRNDRPKGPRSA
jgi:ATP-dependent RNA helicase RhlE